MFSMTFTAAAVEPAGSREWEHAAKAITRGVRWRRWAMKVAPPNDAMELVRCPYMIRDIGRIR
jgi:hypothetical protein